MSWNGSGSIVWPYDWTDERDKGNPDNIISASKFDEQWASAKEAIEATLNRDGENAMAADLSMAGSYHLTNLAAGSAAADSITMRQVADNSVLYGGSTTGSSNAYALSDAVMSSAPAAGMRLLLLANHTNTGAATFNLNSDGATAIVAADGSTALAGGEIVSGDFFEIAYDGTSWCLINSPSGNAGLFTDGSVTIGVNDSVPGLLTIYGGGTGELGGRIHLYNDADQDSTVGYHRIEADLNGNLVFGNDNVGIPLFISQNGDVTLSAVTGEAVVGANDSVPGVLSLYGGGTGEQGGEVRLYNNADDDGTVEWWGVEAEDGTGSFAITEAGTTRVTVASGGNVDVGGTLDVTGEVTLDDLAGGVVKSDASGVISEGWGSAASNPYAATGVSVLVTGIPSWAREIVVAVNSVSVNTGGANDGAMLIQLGDSGGIEATGYSSGATSDSGAYSVGDGFALSDNIFNDGFNAHGHVRIFKGSGNTWYCLSILNVGGVAHSGAGEKTLSGTLDRLQFLWAGGTYSFDSGNFLVYYL